MTRRNSPNPSLAPYTRIVDAVSKTTTPASVVTPAGGGEPRKRRCTTFQAEIVDSIEVNANTEDLISTGEVVDVFNKSNEAMPIGEDIVIGQRPDLKWTIVSWFCE
ncbi:hypothetical protein K227x_64180 [Rubripirellula lacrimiformis]|uniref:Uncharacterized protein n=1 Tax=Rubripirellula lacrimiformis TaxID=1930273 RepID=A0A517NLI3_9BACT|nr:hypothetical protein [Rubripirellula lacrimiformis]QDT07988.1 hypothetical protein K227x_64180 [Rubripirellula lacrimiformis]